MRNAIQYGECNEDTSSERAFFGCRRQRIVAIAAGGGRALSLLIDDPKEVIAIDVNPDQIAVCELRRAALVACERSDYLRFIGVGEERQGDAAWREKQFARIGTDLPKVVATYWTPRIDVIRAGLSRAGAHERGARMVSRWLRIVAGRAVAELSACRDMKRQRRFVQEALSRKVVRIAIAVAFSRISGRLVFRDRSFYGAERIRSSSYVLERLRGFLLEHPQDTSFLLRFYLEGGLRADGPLPLYMRSGNYELVRRRARRIEFVHADLLEYLRELPDRSVDAVSLSDLGSYASTDYVERVLHQVVRVGRSGAVVCAREFLRRSFTLADWPDRLCRVSEVEEELGRTDASIVYTFACARLLAPPRAHEVPLQ